MLPEENITPPQQKRSQRTMLRIFSATRTLLEHKNFNNISIQEIVKAAGCSVGAFYGRFKDKDALLDALDERFFEDIHTRMLPVLDPVSWSEQSFRANIHQIMTILVDIYADQKGLMRTLVIHSRAHQDPRFQAREVAGWKELHQIQDVILSQNVRITHSDPPAAILFGLVQALCAVREIVLWGHLKPESNYPAGQLIDHLTDSFLAYLGIEHS